MNRATTSLPVPDSPVISTVVSVAATCVALRSTSRHSADSPTTRRPACTRSTPRGTPASTRRARSSSSGGSLVPRSLRDAPRPRWYAIQRASGTCARLNASGRFDQNARETRGSGERVDTPRAER